MESQSERILIYCDASEHEPRRVPISNFRWIPQTSEWHEQPASRAGVNAGTGFTLHGDDVDQTGWALKEASENSQRVNFNLECRKCRKPFPLQAPKLYRALDAIRHAGANELALVALAAIVKQQAADQVQREHPEPGQG